MKLYDIITDIETIFATIEDILANPDASPEAKEGALAGLQAQLAELTVAREEKMLWLAKKVLNLEAEAEAVKAEKQKLASRQQRLERQIEGTKLFMQSALTPGTKLKDAAVTIGWRKSTGVVLKGDVDKLPARFQRIKIEAATALLKDCLQNGDPEASEYAVLEERQNIQIK
jgi:hypothetical protein